jgi:hypothetical protein
MTITDVVMIAAVILGPVIAVQLTRYLDNRREIRDRKLHVFKTLMATRSYSISMDHVVALNRIDLEFNRKDKKEKAVIEAWQAYLDHLSNKDITGDPWTIRRVDLFVEMLHKMAQVLVYDFDKTHIKNSSYSPVAHGTLEEQMQSIRIGVVELLAGKRELPVVVKQQASQIVQ